MAGLVVSMVIQWKADNEPTVNLDVPGYIFVVRGRSMVPPPIGRYLYNPK